MLISLFFVGGRWRLVAMLRACCMFRRVDEAGVLTIHWNQTKEVPLLFWCESVRESGALWMLRDFNYERRVPRLSASNIQKEIDVEVFLPYCTLVVRTFQVLMHHDRFQLFMWSMEIHLL